jgi:two-component system, cell cycle sensor histidine kinase and response regulator CckA
MIRTTNTVNPQAIQQVHILILEDNPADARLAVLKLEDAGFEVDGEIASDSSDFMERMHSDVYDTILSDYSIPGWSGRDALRWVRATDKDTPFIFVSGTLGEESAVECIREGATDYVVKGNLERLPVALRRALSDRKLQQLNAQLKQRVAQNNRDLKQANSRLQAEMEEREKAETDLRQAQKLDAIGRLAAGVTHDFNNLLAIILGQSEILLHQSKDAASIARLEVVNESVIRGAALTRQLLAFGRRQILETQILDFNMLLTGVEKLLRIGIGESIELEFQTEAGLENIEADSGQLEQMIINLALNARDAMPMGGKLTITTANVQLDQGFADRRVVIKPGHYVQVVVTDTGCGMDEATQSHIFEPFFTTKEKDKGTGLGLATVYGIIKQIGGYIWVYSELGHGTVFKIYLPIVEAASEPRRPFERLEEFPRGGSETILLVEDDAILREITSDLLQISGYCVIPVESPDRALSLSNSHSGPIDFLLTDVIMPKMNGRELAARLSKERPEMRTLYVSGYTGGILQDGPHGTLNGGLAFLQKPYTRIDLIRKVREILDSKSSNIQPRQN